MDSTNTSRLRKESTVPLDLATPEIKLLSEKSYPFATVLRLRVLQIVCGISSLVMGTVAFIEERGHINLGLGMPAGIFTVIAAGVSVHTSRGFGGYSEPSCTPSLRFLGPRLTVALPLTLLWTAACVLQAVIAILSLLQLILGPRGSQLSVLAALLLALSAATLSAVLALLRIDCRYDPD